MPDCTHRPLRRLRALWALTDDLRLRCPHCDVWIYLHSLPPLKESANV